MESQENDKIFSLTGEEQFRKAALDTFHYQYGQNELYRAYVDRLGIVPGKVNSLREIPFLPIRFFKSHRVMTGQFDAELEFESSGTTGMKNSRHFVKDASLYKKSFNEGFRRVYGDPAGYCIIGLLPSYLERGNSSLVYMVDSLIRESGHSRSGFYLHDHDKLHKTLLELEALRQKTILVGVSFALLDFGEKHPLKLEHTIVMETGGMKGRRREMVREEMHTVLKSYFGVNVIHAEYGMTELLSQAYSKGNGIFRCPAWMRVLVRDESDPLTLQPATGSPVSGVANIIDLANIHSCSFIATDDACRLYPDESFEILGRIDNSDLRGCSLLVN